MFSWSSTHSLLLPLREKDNQQLLQVFRPNQSLCIDCSSRHHAENPHKFHQIMPISALGQISEEHLRRSESWTQAAAELRKNIERAEQFSAEFADMLQHVIDYCVYYRTCKLQELQLEIEELRTAVEYAVKEGDNYINQGVLPASPLGQAAWKLPLELLQVFTYTVSAPDLHTLCIDWAEHQNHLQSLFQPLQHDNPFLAAVLDNRVELYDVSTQQSTQHLLPVNFGGGGSYIALDTHTLMCLGVIPPQLQCMDWTCPPSNSPVCLHSTL